MLSDAVQVVGRLPLNKVEEFITKIPVRALFLLVGVNIHCLLILRCGARAQSSSTKKMLLFTMEPFSANTEYHDFCEHYRGSCIA